MARRKCWIAYTLVPKGSLIIDDGAAVAIGQNSKSLLPSGIVDVQGSFSEGAPVSIATLSNEVLGTGLVNYSSSDIGLIKGLKTSQIESCLGGKHYDEVVHKDNLVITDTCKNSIN